MSSRPQYQQLLLEVRKYFPEPGDGVQQRVRELGLQFLATLVAPAGVARDGARAAPDDGSDRPETIGLQARALQLIGELVSRGSTSLLPFDSHGSLTAPPTLSSILAFSLAGLHNPNLVDPASAGGYREAERLAVAWVCQLIGYPPQRSGGLFTFGGTGTLLYGCKLGLEKAMSGTKPTAGGRQASVIASAAAHYSVATVAGWLGLGAESLLRVPVERDRTLSIAALEDVLREALSAGRPVAAIVATIGTTDGFAVDDLERIVAVRDRLSAEFGLDYRPHVHADAVVGWVWNFFKDYDFEGNPLEFPEAARASLLATARRVARLDLADSIGMDFHKTGYVPYVSSVLVVRESADFAPVTRTSEQMPYLDLPAGHPAFHSLECSRSGAAPLAVLGNLCLLGAQGYRVLIGHAVEMAAELRRRLMASPGFALLNEESEGPLTLIRAYPSASDARSIQQAELTDPEWFERITAHNRFNRRLFERLSRPGARSPAGGLSWTGDCLRPDYPNGPPISAIKSCILSPWIDQESIDDVIALLRECRAQLLAEPDPARNDDAPLRQRHEC